MTGRGSSEGQGLYPGGQGQAGAGAGGGQFGFDQNYQGLIFVGSSRFRGYTAMMRSI